jgi:1-acyl-sn-glycerol-3-phosphate acyltransferase
MWSEADAPARRVVQELCLELGARPVEPASLPDVRLVDLGLDSLACAEMALALQERFGARVAEADITSRSTVADVVRAVERGPLGNHRLPRRLGALQPLAKSLFGRTLIAYQRLEVIGQECVPATGPAVMAANHRSNWDVPIHVVASPRPIKFVAKKELFLGPVVAGFWHRMGGFPVRRELADLRAIDRALAVLEAGELLGIYPEGRRSKRGDQMLPFLQGAAWLALLTGAPIVPSGIVGTGPARTAADRRRRVRVTFGLPIPVEREDDPLLRRKKAQALTAELRTAISALTAIR